MLVWLAAPLIVPAITPGFDQGRLDRTMELTRIMLASPIFLALGALATSLLNARGRFAASAVAPLIYNAAIIGGAVFLGADDGRDRPGDRRRRRSDRPRRDPARRRCARSASATTRRSSSGIPMPAGRCSSWSRARSAWRRAS